MPDISVDTVVPNLLVGVLVIVLGIVGDSSPRPSQRVHVLRAEVDAWRAVCAGVGGSADAVGDGHGRGRHHRYRTSDDGSRGRRRDPEHRSVTRRRMYEAQGFGERGFHRLARSMGDPSPLD